MAPRQGAVAGQKTKKPAGKGSKPKKERKDHAAGMEPLEMYNFSPRAIRRIRMPENCVSFLSLSFLRAKKEGKRFKPFERPEASLVPLSGG